eukprot:scaffold37086_cov44-Phaeocystis_antarctica.AAC.2
MPHMVHFKRTPVWAAMLTRRDRLNIRWLRFTLFQNASSRSFLRRSQRTARLRNRSLPRPPHAHAAEPRTVDTSI